MPKKVSSRAAEGETEKPKKAPTRRKKVESVNAPKKKSALKEVESVAVAEAPVIIPTGNLQSDVAEVHPDFSVSASNKPVNEAQPISTPAVSDTPKAAAKQATPFMPNPVTEERPDVFNIPESDYINPPLHTGMQDIKPKAGTDTDFLAPEHTTFGLKKNNVGSGHWLRNLIYSLIGILVLSVLAYGALAWYSARTLHNEEADLIKVQNDQTATTNSSTTTTPAASQSFEVAVTNTQLKSILDSSLASTLGTGFTNLTAGTAPLKSKLPALTSDTVLYAKDQQQVAQKVVQALSALGVTAQMQENDTLASTVAVYLVPTLTSPNLTGYTAAVYNASGVTGAAKKYCQILANAKVTSCAASNATTTTTGLSIAYKNPKSFFTLARIKEFASAAFAPSPTTQVEDIKVTIGK